MQHSTSVDLFRDWLNTEGPKADIGFLVRMAEREFRRAQAHGEPPEVPQLVVLFDLLRERLSRGQTFEDSAAAIRRARDERLEAF